MFNAPRILNLSHTYFPNFTYYWNSSSPGDVLGLKLPYNVDPRQGNFSFARSAILTITTVSGLVMDGFTYENALYVVSTISAFKNSTFKNGKVFGGVNDNGAFRITNGDHITIDNVTMYRDDP
jgi:hypothetical protein